MRGVWISVDGVEGAGKSTLVDEISARVDALAIREFSDTPVGRALAAAVKTSPHHISTSPLGQSLYFIGEFRERFDTTIAPAVTEGRLVVQDRGYVSKYAYQQAVMEPSLGNAAHELLGAIYRHLSPPDVTVVLHAPKEVIRTRLLERDGACDASRLSFILRAERVFRDPPVRAGRMLHFDSSRLAVERIAGDVLQVVLGMQAS